MTIICLHFPVTYISKCVAKVAVIYYVHGGIHALHCPIVCMSQALFREKICPHSNKGESYGITFFSC